MSTQAFRVAVAPGALILTILLLCWGCWIEDDLEPTTITGIDFVTPHVSAGNASLHVMEATGYLCPDGANSQLYAVTPNSIDGPFPVALLFHDEVLDYVTLDGSNFAMDNRLRAPWAIEQVRRSLGLSNPSTGPGLGEGAWAAALLEAGFAVIAPGNCWGDLWHGRGRNSIAEEGFMRLGASLADDSLRIAAEQLDIDENFVIAVGLGEGGRAFTELIHAGVDLKAAAIDSTPDLLEALLDQPMINAEYIVGLTHIYSDEVGHLVEATDQVAALRTYTRRDSIVHLVTELELRLPIIYSYSPTDPRVLSSLTEPAAVAIETSYQSPPGAYQLITRTESVHVESNRSIDEARGLVAWLLEQTGPHFPDLGDDDSASP
ncbi:MAG: hypothetical protein CMP23_13420 [Rickettsiales bacterium]|nr:hypothetical protein [Rickettsiales bacterium]